MQRGLNLQGVILALSKIWVLRVEGRLAMSTSNQMVTAWVTSIIPGGRILKSQISNLQPLSLWRSETIAGSICLRSLIFKFESLKVILWPSTIYHWAIVSLGNFHFFVTELFDQFCRAAFAQNQMPNNTSVDCSAIDYRLCSQITICNYWLFYQYCILAFNLKT